MIDSVDMHTVQGLIDINVRGAIFWWGLGMELIDWVQVRTVVNSFMICELQACIPCGVMWYGRSGSADILEAIETWRASSGYAIEEASMEVSRSIRDLNAVRAYLT